MLYDFAVHWFDIVTCFMGEAEPTRVYASYEPSPTQQADPPLLGQAVIEYENAQATLSFDADTPVGPEDRTTVVGTRGTIRSEGPDLEQQSVRLYTEEGYAEPDLEERGSPMASTVRWPSCCPPSRRTASRRTALETTSGRSNSATRRSRAPRTTSR